MNPESQIIRRPRKWPLYAGIAVAALAVLYFVLTSAFFVRAVVLPQVESALASRLEVGGLSLSPFSQLELRDVKMTPNGAEPLVQVGLVRVRYSLSALLGGKIQAHEVTVEKPVISLVEGPDGTRNLPKLPPSAPKKPAPIALDLHQVQVRDGQLTYTVRGPKGVVQTATVSGLNVTLDQLVTGLPGKLAIQGQVGLERPASDGLAAKLGGEFEVVLGPEALPKRLKGTLALDVAQARGAFADAAGLGASLESDLTDAEVRTLGLSFRRAGQELGRLRLSGPYDLAKTELRLDYELSGIDRRVLVLVAGSLGVDLGDTAVAAKGRFNVLKAGQVVASDGEISLAKVSLGLPGGRTPVLGLRTQYKAEVNLADSLAVLETLQVGATDARGEWLTGTLDRPMNLSWGKTATGFQPSQFSLRLSRFDLAEWRAVLGTNAPTGGLQANLTVVSDKDGRLLKFALDGLADRLTAQVGGSPFRDGALVFSGNGTFNEFNAFALTGFEFNLRQRDATLVAGNAVADWQSKTGTGGAQANVSGDMASVLGLFPMPGIGFQQGRFKVSTQVNQKPSGTALGLTVNLDKLTGEVQGTRLADYQATVQVNASLSGNVLDLQRLNLAAGNAIQPGGSIDASGRWDLTKRSGTLEYRITGLNQSALEPWLAGALRPNRLEAVRVEASGKAQVDLAADSSFTTDLRVVGLRTAGPKGETNTMPDLSVNLDVAGRPTLLELRKAALQLGATDRARNELLLSGRLDLSTNKPSPSTLSIRSDGLDLTPLHRLLGGSPAAPKPAPAKPSTPPPAAAPAMEPGPVALPLARLTVDLDVAKLFLGSVRAEKWKGRVEVSNSVVSVKPFDLVLNGTPVSLATWANLGVPGWQYDVSLKAPDLDLAPFVDTFQPAYQGKVSGHLTTDVSLKGAGITGLGLQKNLAGAVRFQSTNLNIDLAGLQDARKRQLAQMVTQPKEGLLTLIGQGFGVLGVARTPGWYEEISRSPIDTLVFRGEASGGRFQIQEAVVQSPVLRVVPTGTITFRPVLDDSPLAVPVALALRGAVARQLGVSQETNRYVALPDLLTIEGTLGAPDPKVNKLHLAAVVAKYVPNMVGGVVGGLLDKVTDGKAGAVTERVGGVLNALGGAAGTATGTAGATAGSAASALGAALGAVTGGGKPAVGAATNVPAGAAATNAPARKPSALDVLNALVPPKPKATNAPAPKK